MNINIIKNAKKNLAAGFLNKAVTMLSPLIVRSVIQRTYGAKYLGLNSLFSSILTVLSLSELGFCSAITYNMFKPASEDNVQAINALLKLYRRVYVFVGIAVLGIGICLIPFFPYLISGSYPEGINIYVIYLIVLGNSVLSYLVYAYQASLTVVYQRSDIVSNTATVTTVLRTAAEIILLLIVRNYYFYAAALPIFTVINNISVARKVNKLFPQYKCEGEVSAETKKQIKFQVGGAFLTKACHISRNALDNICISAFLGLAMTSVYSNYLGIMLSVTAFLEIVSSAFLGGIGNHISTLGKAENFDELSRLDFCYMWLSGWCAVCLLCLFQPFMELWMGKDMLLPKISVLLIVFYFYLLEIGAMRSMYTSASGLWWEQRHRAVTEMLLNILMNIILGRIMGINGIIIATIITIIINQIWASLIVFRKYFEGDSMIRYFKYQIKYFITAVLMCAVTYGCCLFVKTESLFITLPVRAVLCLIVPNAGYYLIFRKTEHFKYLANKLGSLRRKEKGTLL